MINKENNQEADKEIRNFHIQLLTNVIKVVELNKNYLDKQYKLGILKHSNDFHQGALMFADVIINQINEEKKRIKRSDAKRK